MEALLFLVVLTALGFGLAAGIGLVLPKRYTYTHTERYEAGVEKIWRIITSHLREKDWRSDLFASDRMQDREGKQVWKESRRNNKVVYLQTTQLSAPHSYNRKSVDHKNLAEEWQFQIQKNGEQSEVQLTLTLELTKPLSRFKYYLFDRNNKAPQRYLQDLKHYVLSLQEEE